MNYINRNTIYRIEVHQKKILKQKNRREPYQSVVNCGIPADGHVYKHTIKEQATHEKVFETMSTNIRELGRIKHKANIDAFIKIDESIKSLQNIQSYWEEVANSDVSSETNMETTLNIPSYLRVSINESSQRHSKWLKEN